MVASEPEITYQATRRSLEGIAMTGPEQSPADPADLLPAWNALVEKTLGGASFEKLVTSTYDGVQISPLYGPHTPGGVPEEGSGYPGQFPHIRGRTSASTALSGWDIRQLATPGDLTETNALILEDLQGASPRFSSNCGMVESHGSTPLMSSTNSWLASISTWRPSASKVARILWLPRLN